MTPHFEKVTGFVGGGVAEGAELVVDSRGVKIDGHGGYYLGPCLFDHVKLGMTIYQQGSLDGTGCDSSCDPPGSDEHDRRPRVRQRYVPVHARRRAALLRRQHTSGMVGINVPLPVPIITTLFGGWKRSLFGDLRLRTGSVRFYIRRKAITRRWPSSHVRKAPCSTPAASSGAAFHACSGSSAPGVIGVTSAYYPARSGHG